VAKWTGEEINFLRDNYESMEHEEMGKHLGRTGSSVKAKCWKLKLLHSEKFWTEEEINFLRDNYGTMEHEEMGKHLGRTRNSVRAKCWKLNIVKLEKFWSDNEIKLLTDYYQNNTGSELDLYFIAQELGRTRWSVANKANELKLTTLGRPRSEKSKKKMSEKAKNWIAKKGHLKGCLEKSMTQVLGPQSQEVD